jgi:hypothetical protein
MEKYEALLCVSQTMIGIWYGNDASKFELSDISHAVNRCDELFDYEDDGDRVLTKSRAMIELARRYAKK